MKLFHKALFWTALCGFLPFPCSYVRASAWSLAPGEAAVEIYTGVYQTDTDYDRAGKRSAKPNAGSYESVTAEIKMQAGMPHPKLNLLLVLPCRKATYKDDNITLNHLGVSDMRAGLSYVLGKDGQAPRVFALSAEAHLPTGNTDKNPALGKDEYGVDMRLLWGQLLFPKTVGTPDAFERRHRAFMAAEAGCRIWEKASDQIVYFAQTGCHLGKGISLQAELDGVEAFDSAGESYTILRWGPSWSSRDGAGPPEIKHENGRRKQESAVSATLQMGRVLRGKNTSDAREFVAKIRWIRAF